jgi:hypothetical protein
MEKVSRYAIPRKMADFGEQFTVVACLNSCSCMVFGAILCAPLRRADTSGGGSMKGIAPQNGKRNEHIVLLHRLGY